jgi:hypothetical protein
MMNLDDDLAAMGFARAGREPACWQAVRLRRPAGCATSDAAQEPAHSQTLLRWRRLLRRDTGRSPYRISRAG